MAEDTKTTKGPKDRRSRLGMVGRFALITGVIPYLGFTAMMATFQRSFLYHPVPVPGLSVNDADRRGMEVADVQLTTDDDETLHGWLIQHTGTADDSSKHLVLFFPGNARNRSNRLRDLTSIASCGTDVLIFDYRGYADSTGSPTEPALTSDAARIWQFATEQLGYAEEDIVIYGESLGGGVALSLWSGPPESHPHPRAVMLRSTFTSMTDTVSWHYPMFPFRLVLLDHWPSIERIPFVECEIVIFSGTEDAVVPFEHGRLLSEAAQNATFVEMPDADHDAIPVRQRAEFLRRLFAH